MKLTDLSNENLHRRTIEAAGHEKLSTLTLLEFLAEVDERRLYNRRGYGTLWEYVHKGLGYSEAQASERVSAMRLIRKMPAVREQLKKGSLNLTTTAKLASFVRRENCSNEKTFLLLGKISNKGIRETDRILISEQTIPVRKPDTFRPTGPSATRISFDADPEFLKLFEELRDLQGRPDWSMKDRLKEAMRELIRRKKGLKTIGPSVSPPSTDSGKSQKTDLSRPLLRAAEARRSRYISILARNIVRDRSGGRCEYVDDVESRRCESRFGLQFDHIHPFALGGASTSDNIRHLCASHNRFQAVQIFGERFERRDAKLHPRLNSAKLAAQEVIYASTLELGPS